MRLHTLECKELYIEAGDKAVESLWGKDYRIDQQTQCGI